VNSELALLYWRLGVRIRQDILGQERAAYGQQIVSTLSRKLKEAYGLGYSPGNLFHMIRFAEVWPDEAAATELTRELGWSHLAEVIYLEDPCSGNSTPKCAAWSDGASGPCATASAACFSSEPPSRGDRKS
jgi:hypothetical protein